MRYILLEKDSSWELSKEVNEYLRMGWELYGQPVHTPEKDTFFEERDEKFCQAMIKKD